LWILVVQILFENATLKKNCGGNVKSDNSNVTISRYFDQLRLKVKVVYQLAFLTGFWVVTLWQQQM